MTVVIELYGCPGAGKSTISGVLAHALTDAGYTVAKRGREATRWERAAIALEQRRPIFRGHPASGR